MNIYDFYQSRHVAQMYIICTNYDNKLSVLMVDNKYNNDNIAISKRAKAMNCLRITEQLYTKQKK